MSIQQARQFLKRIAEDPEIAEKVRESYAQAVLHVALSSGYEFSMNDLDMASSEDITEGFDSPCFELSVEDLSEVTGGNGEAYELVTWIYNRAYSDFNITTGTTEAEFVEIFQSLPSLLPADQRQVGQAIVDNIILKKNFRPAAFVYNTL